ncbi:TrkA family potassium uptake protein [Eubacteriales bacterium OttesenSCG-928-N13]|nr:TrkA family potassium uptake protein [Eubacteriales bacterium OttesenSCG-928-N13]
MGLFKTIKKQNYTIIIGCSRMGANLADTLSSAGRSVLIIDRTEEAFKKLSPFFGGISLVGDGTEILVLNEADIKHATEVVAVTNSDNTNILLALLAKEHFGVGHVIARLSDPERECVYQEFGIETICPAELSAKEINRLLSVEEVVEEDE